MRRNSQNFTIDVLSFLGMLALLGTGLLMKFTLPPGSGGRTVWGLGRHGWGDVHFWIAVALVSFIALHLALHWAWVYATSRRVVRGDAEPRPRNRVRERAVGGVFLLVVVALVSGFLVATRASIVTPPRDAPAAEHAGGHEAGTHP